MEEADRDVAVGYWAVSSALREVLEHNANLRHAEPLLLNRKIYTLQDLREMGDDDETALLTEIVHHWTALRWNIAQLPAQLKSLLQEVRSTTPGTGTPHTPGPIQRASEAALFRPAGRGAALTGSNDAETLFPKFFSHFRTRQCASNSRNCPDATSALLSPGLATTLAVCELIQDLQPARGLLGETRFRAILRQLQMSEMYAAESAACTALALQLADEVPVKKETEEESKRPIEERPLKLLKNAKLRLRNSLLFRVIGWAQGIDSKQALEDRFPKLRDAAQTRAQMIKAFSNMRDRVAQFLTGIEKALPMNTKTRRPKPKHTKKRSGLLRCRRRRRSHHGPSGRGT
jgi:hypothetical protein